MLLAHVVALGHAAAVVLLLVGGLLALRHPRVLWVHVPACAAIGAVYLAGADCPLTTLELELRQRAGGQAYSGGFLGHYVLAPLRLDRTATVTQAGLLLAALLPNVAAAVLLVRRRRADRRPEQQESGAPTSNHLACEPPASPSSPEPLSSPV